MVSEKLSISLSPELAESVRMLARRRGEDVSRLIETLLREAPLVQSEIRESRSVEPLGTKKGRSIQELRVLGRVARRAWRDRLESGEVKIVGKAK